jgi:acetylglutamate kinase
MKPRQQAPVRAIALLQAKNLRRVHVHGGPCVIAPAPRRQRTVDRLSTARHVTWP